MIATFDDCPVEFLTSQHRHAANVYVIGGHTGPRYAVFLYADYQLHKVAVVGEFLCEAHDVADVIAQKFTDRSPESFSGWVNQEFPDDINHMTYRQIANLFE